MLSGEYLHSIDAKGRLTIPAKFRDVLGEEFVVTKSVDRCLLIFPESDWADFKQELKKLPRSKNARDYIRHMVGSAEKVGPDKMGRALIPQALRSYAGLEKDVVLTGVLDRIEIWDKSVWDENNSKTSDNIDSITEELAALGFNI